MIEKQHRTTKHLSHQDGTNDEGIEYEYEEKMTSQQKLVTLHDDPPFLA
jgi:hypothetical protein